MPKVNISNYWNKKVQTLFKTRFINVLFKMINTIGILL